MLTACPLYRGIINKNHSALKDPSTLVDMLANPKLESGKIRAISKTIDEILTINEKYTSYYKREGFHNLTGDCVIL